MLCVVDDIVVKLYYKCEFLKYNILHDGQYTIPNWWIIFPLPCFRCEPYIHKHHSCKCMYNLWFDEISILHIIAILLYGCATIRWGISSQYVGFIYTLRQFMSFDSIPISNCSKRVVVYNKCVILTWDSCEYYDLGAARPVYEPCM